MKPAHLIAVMLFLVPATAHSEPESVGHISGNVVATASLQGAGNIIYGLSVCGADTEPYPCPEEPQTDDTLILSNATWMIDGRGDITVTSGTLMTYADFISAYGIAGINAINQQGGSF